MARIRTIKPKFWDDSKLAKVSRDARLTFIAMWNFSDDLGVIIAEPVWLKSKIFPYDQIQLTQFNNWLNDLSKNGFISLFSHNGEEFYYLPNLTKHQVINRPNYDDVFVEKVHLERILNDSVINHGIINDESVPERKGKERKGKEEENAHARDDYIKKIILPFLDFDFSSEWEKWKIYKKTEFNFSYKSLESEQSALNELQKLSKNNFETAVKILNKSISQGWKGFFELKNEKDFENKKSDRGASAVVNVFSQVKMIQNDG